MLRDARLVAAKDLRLEWRTRVALNQVLPFALLVLILFAFALDPDRGLLARVTAGLFWVAVLFSALLAIARSASIEAPDGIRDSLRLSGLEPGGIFLGKAAAIFVQLLVLEVLLLAGVVVLYDARLDGLPVLIATCVAATAGLAAAGAVYGLLSAGLRVRETLLPLLLLPVLAPVLIAATQCFDAAFADRPGEATRWLGLLVLFAVAFVAAGVAVYGILLDES